MGQVSSPQPYVSGDVPLRLSTHIACLLALMVAGPTFAGTQAESAKPKAAAAAAPGGAATPPEAPLLVDINRASLETLKTLPGVGDAEAEKIVAARPYKTKAELVTKKALPMGVFLNLKRNVTVQLKPARSTKVQAKGKKLKS